MALLALLSDINPGQPL